MKNLTIILISILIFTPLVAQARSEITGYISTDPERVNERIDPIEPNKPNGNPEDNNTNNSGGGSIINLQNRPVAKTENREGEEKDKIDLPADKETKPLVKGIAKPADNTLVRDQGGRIYIIKGEIKKVVWDLAELWQHRGQPILDLPDSELAQYPTRRFYNGELIRQQGTAPVYVLDSGRKRHIKSLEELKRRYLGQEIYNLPVGEFGLY